MSEATTETLEGLEAERRRLALAVEEGEATAEELERCEAKIQALRRDEERRQLAERERVARGTREQAQREAEERARLEAEHRQHDGLFKGRAWELGEVVRKLREEVGAARLFGSVPIGAGELGEALAPVRAAMIELTAAAETAEVSAACAGVSTAPYRRVNMLLKAYLVARLGRRAAEMLVGPIEPLQARPGRDVERAIVDFFEGTR